MQPDAEKQLTTEEVGFRPLFTRAPVVDRLLGAPSQYDAAPTYLVREFAEHTQEVKGALVKASAAAAAEGASDSFKRQMGIAVELAAPVGFGIVRAYALAGLLGRYVLAANPVFALLSAPALFFTGKRLLTDLRRAFRVDPKVRELMERANRLAEAGAYGRAEACLKEALEQDINPDYRRNGDLYMQLGLVQVQDGRPRQAMVSFARASVLFHEDDSTTLERDGDKVHVSKRGLAEVLAVASIDSFASDEKGLNEWRNLVEDIGGSALRRLESFSDRKEAGHLLGLFGRDAASGVQGRELMAKVRFFQAKMKLRAASLENGGEVQRHVDEALEELERANLEPEEQFHAVLEQSQFYCDMASRGGKRGAEWAELGVRLMNRAAELVERDDPRLAARTRAEVAAFAMEAAPNLGAHDIGKVLEPVLESLRHDLRFVETKQLPFGEMALGWVEEQRYLLSHTVEAKAGAIDAAAQAYLEADEPVAAMYASLRLAYLRDEAQERDRALEVLEKAARLILERRPDPVSTAFAGKYLLDAAKVTGHEVAELDREQSARNFAEAAEHVRRERTFTALYLNGHPVVHSWHVAEQVLQGQAALEFARAGKWAKGLVLFERVQAGASDASDPIRLAMQLEYAILVVESGRKEEGLELLREVEDDARKVQNAEVQRRALELLKVLQDSDVGRARSVGLQSVSDGEARGALAEPPELAAAEADLSSPADEKTGGDGALMEAFADRRDLLVRTAQSIVEAMREAGLTDRLAAGDHSPVVALEGRLKRLKQGRFRIAIVGEFSVGKSTFLNALLGDKILPSSVRPTTSVLTRLVWAAEYGCRILFRDGREETHPLEALRDFVTERGNRENRKGVAEVIIGGPLPLLANGVELVDTPGLSSLIADHDRTTWEIVPGCDALILLAAARQPYSDSVESFFREMKGFVNDKVFYVLNKLDQVEATKVPQALSFAEERVGADVEGARVFGISSYSALAGRRLASGRTTEEELGEDARLEGRDPKRLLADSGLTDLEGAISGFLSDTRGGPLLSESAGAVEDLVLAVERLLLEEQNAAQMTVAEARARFRKIAGEYADRSHRLEADLAKTVRSLHSAVMAEVSTACAGLREGLAERTLQALHVTHESFGSEEDIADLRVRARELLREGANEAAAEVSGRIEKELREHALQARALLQELRHDLSREERGIAIESLPRDDALVSVEARGFGEAVGSFAIGGILGWVGGALLGPLGVVLAMAGSTLIGGLIGEQRFEERKAKLLDGLEESSRKIADEMESRLSEHCERLMKDFEDRVSQEGAAVLAGYETELVALTQRAEDEETTARDQHSSLHHLQMRTRSARQVLRGFRE